MTTTNALRTNGLWLRRAAVAALVALLVYIGSPVDEATAKALPPANPREEPSTSKPRSRSSPVATPTMPPWESGSQQRAEEETPPPPPPPRISTSGDGIPARMATANVVGAIAPWNRMPRKELLRAWLSQGDTPATTTATNGSAVASSPRRRLHSAVLAAMEALASSSGGSTTTRPLGLSSPAAPAIICQIGFPLLNRSPTATNSSSTPPPGGDEQSLSLLLELAAAAAGKKKNTQRRIGAVFVVHSVTLNANQRIGFDALRRKYSTKAFPFQTLAGKRFVTSAAGSGGGGGGVESHPLRGKCDLVIIHANSAFCSARFTTAEKMRERKRLAMERHMVRERERVYQLAMSLLQSPLSFVLVDVHPPAVGTPRWRHLQQCPGVQLDYLQRHRLVNPLLRIADFTPTGGQEMLTWALQLPASNDALAEEAAGPFLSVRNALLLTTVEGQPEKRKKPSAYFGRKEWAAYSKVLQQPGVTTLCMTSSAAQYQRASLLARSFPNLTVFLLGIPPPEQDDNGGGSGEGTAIHFHVDAPNADAAGADNDQQANRNNGKRLRRVHLLSQNGQPPEVTAARIFKSNFIQQRTGGRVTKKARLVCDVLSLEEAPLPVLLGTPTGSPLRQPSRDSIAVGRLLNALRMISDISWTTLVRPRYDDRWMNDAFERGTLVKLYSAMERTEEEEVERGQQQKSDDSYSGPSISPDFGSGVPGVVVARFAPFPAALASNRELVALNRIPNSKASTTTAATAADELPRNDDGNTARWRAIDMKPFDALGAELTRAVGAPIVEGHSGELFRSRQMYVALASMPWVERICEIGFNAGHSASLWLMANPTAEVLMFDLWGHPYNSAGEEFLRSVHAEEFGIINGSKRLTIVKGSSATTVPTFAMANPAVRCNLLSVDGGHTFPQAVADLLNMKQLANESAHVLVVDDTNCRSRFCVDSAIQHLQGRGVLYPFMHISELMEELGGGFRRGLTVLQYLLPSTTTTSTNSELDHPQWRALRHGGWKDDDPSTEMIVALKTYAALMEGLQQQLNATIPSTTGGGNATTTTASHPLGNPPRSGLSNKERVKLGVAQFSNVSTVCLVGDVVPLVEDVVLWLAASPTGVRVVAFPRPQYFDGRRGQKDQTIVGGPAVVVDPHGQWKAVEQEVLRRILPQGTMNRFSAVLRPSLVQALQDDAVSLAPSTSSSAPSYRGCDVASYSSSTTNVDEDAKEEELMALRNLFDPLRFHLVLLDGTFCPPDPTAAAAATITTRPSNGTATTTTVAVEGVGCLDGAMASLQRQRVLEAQYHVVETSIHSGPSSSSSGGGGLLPSALTIAKFL